MFVQALFQIATFNVINTKIWIDKHLYTLPEEDAYTMSFYESGYESAFLISNASSVVWIFILHFTGIVFVFGPIYLIHQISGKLANTNNKLSKYFFWNGLLRLFLESCFEMALSAILNIHQVDWATRFPSATYSNALTVISLILLGLIPLILTVLYFKNFSFRTDTTSLMSRFTTFIVGTKYKLKNASKSILAYPVLFVARRIIFAMSAVYLVDFLWA